MEDNIYLIKEKDETASISKIKTKLDVDDSYVCTTCSYPIEILRIDDKENTITFKCLNPKEKENKKQSQLVNI